MVAIPDLIYSILFLLYLVYWKRKTKEIKVQVVQKSCLPSLFTIEVTGFSRNLKDAEILKSHFN